MAKTTFLVLQQTDDGVWTEIGNYDASDYRAAIQNKAAAEGIFVAVPVLGWRPRKMIQEVVSVTRLEPLDGEPAKLAAVKETP